MMAFTSRCESAENSQKPQIDVVIARAHTKYCVEFG
jgi:hypothetical protein